MFELDRSHPVLRVMIYHPPKYNKNFISDFSEFWADIMPKYDHVLILEDMSVHVCCPTKPLARDFLNLIEAFNVVEYVTGNIPEHGHTLELVLSCGLPVFNVEICDADAVFSDHMPVLLEISPPRHTAAQSAPACTCHMFKPSAAV